MPASRLIRKADPLPRVVQLDDGRLAFDPEPGITLVYTPVDSQGIGKVSIEFAPEKS